MFISFIGNPDDDTDALNRKQSCHVESENDEFLESLSPFSGS